MKRYALRLPLDERLALALAEDCGTELDETDVGHVVEAVIPVVQRHLVDAGEPWRDRLNRALDLTDRFDPTCGSDRTRVFVADLTRILRGEAS